ncbi:MAG: hypothetical protein ACRD4S_07005 [Candidatus Acidiferrales bacterium]
MTTKAPIPINSLASANQSKSRVTADPATLWNEARLAYPLYAALATQFDLAPLLHAAGELPPARPTREIFDRDLEWLNTIDEKVRAFQIRQLPPETLNASEASLRAFLQRQLKKPEKASADRDKIDLLLVQYFALCAPEELYRSEFTLADVARVLQPVLGGADSTPVEWCAPLDEILNTLENCQSLRDMMEHGLLEQGRLLKETAGPTFYDPAALVAFCRFNFRLRRAFIRMLHADLNAMKAAVEHLDASGIKTVDCRRAGFSAAETTTQLRYYCENWRQPFHKDYTENSVTRTFDQLFALRADLEEALVRVHSAATQQFFAVDARENEGTRGDPVPASANVPSTSAPELLAATNPEEVHADHASPVANDAPSVGSVTVAKPGTDVASGTPPIDAEKCLDSIWEQLIAAPPSRGRSMSTVVLQDTKVLLSSWEVAAFVTEGDQEAEDLRRAVVARALLAVAMDFRKRSGDLARLGSALALARGEVSYFQGRVETAKRAKNTEAAVNLGISTKRVLSVIEEAEKLQP